MVGRDVQGALVTTLPSDKIRSPSEVRKDMYHKRRQGVWIVLKEGTANPLSL